jgi:hypothetical protein
MRVTRVWWVRGGFLVSFSGQRGRWAPIWEVWNFGSFPAFISIAVTVLTQE